MNELPNHKPTPNEGEAVLQAPKFWLLLVLCQILTDPIQKYPTPVWPFLALTTRFPLIDLLLLVSQPGTRLTGGGSYLLHNNSKCVKHFQRSNVIITVEKSVKFNGIYLLTGGISHFERERERERERAGEREREKSEIYF